ncbi:MAG: Stk1 family PASTA domain-containing Ser/Thr kinase [Ruminococcaceae bacterium]|nr:Stk1 family PASTA domain-containing Ser/Thr kinase [Oscillospiraceae bacterium]
MNMEGYENYAGQVFDNRYRILKTIGVGGMAVVFEAYDLLEKRTVAVKMLREDIARDEQQVRRFVNESRAVAMLSHPNIVKIYNISVKSNIKFIVMEYIEGITLKDYMTKRGVLSLNEIISYTEQILHALDHAHAKGVVHRDIKPQNIMLLKNGVIKVMDFGIAKLPNSETLTLTDKAIGTVFYISPEQAEGKASDRRSDLYSLGVMMYEMSCGKLPFYDESPISVALKQIKDEPTPPRNINPSIPRGLEQIILSAMEKDPDVRFQSAAQMLRQLARLKADPTIVFKPNHKVETAHKNAEKKRKESDRRSSSSGERSMFPIIFGVVSAFLVVFVVSLIVIFSAFFSGDSSVITITVPNVVGYTYTTQDAVGLSSTYYKVEIEEKYDADSLKGQILEQYPTSGQKVKVSANKQKQTVRLTVSLGAETIILENYENQSRRDVELALKKLGLKVKTETIYSDTVTGGKVCYTYPAAGDAAAVGSTVTIYVSLGKVSGSNAVEVPDFRNYNETDARKLAAELSIIIAEVVYEESDKEVGRVIGQSLVPGTSVTPNSEIVLTVSGKQNTIGVGRYVPNITGLTVIQAENILSQYGLRLGKRSEMPSDLEEGLIVEQYPSPSTPITADITRVDFTVSNGEYAPGHTEEYLNIDGFMVPNIVGMTLKKARKLLEENELDLGDGYTVRSDAPSGTIVRIWIAYDYNDNPVVDYEISG